MQHHLFARYVTTTVNLPMKNIHRCGCWAFREGAELLDFLFSKEWHIQDAGDIIQCDVETRWPNTVNDCMISGDLLDLLYMTYFYHSGGGQSKLAARTLGLRRRNCLESHAEGHLGRNGDSPSAGVCFCIFGSCACPWWSFQNIKWTQEPLNEKDIDGRRINYTCNAMMICSHLYCIFVILQSLVA